MTGSWAGTRGCSPEFADLAGVTAGKRVLDVGCGPGALTAELVRRVGAASVAAVDPSEPFVGRRARYPGVAVRRAPRNGCHSDAWFDATLAQLVVHFMADPVVGIWRWRGSRGPTAWSPRACGTTAAARAVRPSGRRRGSSTRPSMTVGPGRGRVGHLAALFAVAGLREIEERTLSVTLEHATFDAWWEPFTRGVGPAGSFGTSPTPNAGQSCGNSADRGSRRPRSR